MPWYFDPQSGGNKIPVNRYETFRAQAQAFGHTRKWFPRCQLSLRFKGQFCYIDVLEQGETAPSLLARLRYFRDNEFSMAFFTWSHERYEACVFSNGKWQGTLEQANETCEPFLSGSF